MRKFGKILTAPALLTLVLLWYSLVPPPQPAHAQFSAAATFIVVGGSPNAVSAAIPNVSAYADLKGVTLSFLAASTNTGPTTLNVNSLGNVNVLRINSLGLGGGELRSTTLTSVVFTGTAFLITSAQDTTPVGTAINVRGSAAPSGYLIEDGTCVSQTTYAALFSVIGGSYGSCGAGQFALPDSRGRFFAASDNQGGNGAANRITNAVSGCTATAVPFSCGNQGQTVSVAYLPASGLSVPGLSVPSLTTSAVSIPALSVQGLAIPALSVPGLVYSGNASIPVAGLVSIGGSTDVNRVSLKNNANTDAGSFNNIPYSGTTAGGVTGTSTTGAGATDPGTSGTGTTGTGTTGTGTTGNMGFGAALPILNPVLGGLRAVKY